MFVHFHVITDYSFIRRKYRGKNYYRKYGYYSVKLYRQVCVQLSSSKSRNFRNERRKTFFCT